MCQKSLGLMPKRYTLKVFPIGSEKMGIRDDCRVDQNAAADTHIHSSCCNYVGVCENGREAESCDDQNACQEPTYIGGPAIVIHLEIVISGKATEHGVWRCC